LRTKEKKEVDFLLEVDGLPTCMLEVKTSSSGISPTLRYFHKKYDIPAIQLVKNLSLERVDNGIEVRSVFNYLSKLVM
jgi:hypothetical protein